MERRFNHIASNRVWWLAEKRKEGLTMGIRVIEEGDKAKKGNMVCPKCGQTAIIDQYYGDPPHCDCGTPYRPIPEPISYY